MKAVHLSKGSADPEIKRMTKMQTFTSGLGHERIGIGMGERNERKRSRNEELSLLFLCKEIE